ncbi:MAG TPA: hypothetical protein VNP92_03780, partial [Actinophytocola sp.]|nr:hypothetical protein [Actinophytocola sp.]
LWTTPPPVDNPPGDPQFPHYRHPPTKRRGERKAVEEKDGVEKTAETRQAAGDKDERRDKAVRA